MKKTNEKTKTAVKPASKRKSVTQRTEMKPKSTEQEREIGISVSFGKPGFKKSLKLIKDAGFKNIMILENGRNLARLLKTARKFEFNIPYVHLSYKKPFSVNSLWVNGSAREKLVKNFVARIEVCKKYGVDTAVIHCARRVNELDYTLDKEAGLESIKEILQAAEKYNVKLAFENLNKPENEYLNFIFANFKSPNLGLCYDCGHHFLHSPEVDFSKQFAGRCFAVHLHDNMTVQPAPDPWRGDLHGLPGDGKIDFDKVIKNLAQLNYKGILMLECSKVSGLSDTYNSMSDAEFLAEAYKRGKKLAVSVGQSSKKSL